MNDDSPPRRARRRGRSWSRSSSPSRDRSLGRWSRSRSRSGSGSGSRGRRGSRSRSPPRVGAHGRRRDDDASPPRADRSSPRDDDPFRYRREFHDANGRPTGRGLGYRGEDRDDNHDRRGRAWGATTTNRHGPRRRRGDRDDSRPSPDEDYNPLRRVRVRVSPELGRDGSIPIPASSDRVVAAANDSLGWRAESAIVPGRAEPIVGVDAASMLPLRAELLAAKRRVAERSEAAGTFDALESRRRVRAGRGDDGERKASSGDKGVFSSSSSRVRNRGVGERARRDAAAETDRSERGVRVALERKAALYAKLEREESTRGDASYDVDFEAKRIERRGRGEDERRGRGEDDRRGRGEDDRRVLDRERHEPYPSAPSTTHSRFPRDPWAYGDGRGTVDSGTGSIGWSDRGHARGREDVERGIAAAAAAEAAAEAAKSAAAKSAAEATAAGRVAAADARAEAETLREKRRAKMLLVKKRLEAFHAEAGER